MSTKIETKPERKLVSDWRQGNNTPHDRGGADSYYRRARSPHYKWNWSRVLEADMTLEQVAEYNAGYDANEAAGDHNEWN
jgi:hypothetical protein